MTQDFIFALRACWFAFTRDPDSDRWLLQRAVDEFLESSISIFWLAHQGVFNVGRRELRYMLEAVVKYVYVDEQVPGGADLRERVAKVQTLPRSSISPIDDLVLRMQPNPKAFRDAVHSSFGALNGFVHVSKRQVEDRLGRASRGEFSGFEGAGTVEAFAGVVRGTYDLLLALIFGGIGPGLTGDLFINVLDDRADWTFHRTRFVSLVSKHFDYKLERQERTRGT
jgi:hypothetical protein